MSISPHPDSCSGWRYQSLAFVWNTSLYTARFKLPPCSSLFLHIHSSLLGAAAQSCRQVHFRRCAHLDPHLQSHQAHCLFSTRWTPTPSCTGKYFLLGAVYIGPWDQKLPPANKPSHSLKDMSHLTHPASPPHTQIPFTGPDPSTHTNHTRPQSKFRSPGACARRRTAHLSPRDVFHPVPQNTATCTRPALFSGQVLHPLRLLLLRSSRPRGRALA